MPEQMIVTHLPSYARGDVLMVTRVAEDEHVALVRVLEVESMPDGARLLVQPYAAEKDR